MSIKRPAPPSAQATLEALMGVFAGVKRALHHALRDSGTPPPMLLRLLQLCQRQPGITQQALAQQTGRDKGQVARMVKDLLADGLVERTPDPDDGRRQRLSLTPAGRRAVQHFERAEAEVAGWLFDGVALSERAALLDRLVALRQRLDAQADPARDPDGTPD